MQKSTALAFAASGAWERLARQLLATDPTRAASLPDAPARRLAWLLNITPSAVYQWSDTLPESTAYKLQVLTGGRLRVEEPVDA